MVKDATYKTILVLTTGLIVLSLIFKSAILLYIAISIALFCLVSPFIAEKTAWLWGKIGELLGWINSRVILSAVFYLFLTPIAFISKIFTKNNLKLKNNHETSLFVSREHTYTADDLENPW